jgi:drug/metabolite transporter (DMT)-like permease
VSQVSIESRVLAGDARTRLAGIACALGSVLLFSGFTLVSRLGLRSSLGVLDLAALRFGIGGCLLLPILLKYGLRGVSLLDASLLSLCGGLGFATLAYSGFRLASAAHGTVFLHGTLTPFTYLILRATRRTPTQRVSGVALVAAGVLLMALDSCQTAGTRELWGDALLLLASLSWSAYSVRLRALALPPAQAAAIVAVFSMCAFFPLYACLPGKGLLTVAPRELALQALVQGVLVGATSIFVYTRAVALLGAAETTLFTAAVPCLTTLAAIPLLGERPTLPVLAGVGVVTLGLIIAARAKRPALERR